MIMVKRNNMYVKHTAWCDIALIWFLDPIKSLMKSKENSEHFSRSYNIYRKFHTILVIHIPFEWIPMAPRLRTLLL